MSKKISVVEFYFDSLRTPTMGKSGLGLGMNRVFLLIAILDDCIPKYSLELILLSRTCLKKNIFFKLLNKPNHANFF